MHSSIENKSIVQSSTIPEIRISLNKEVEENIQVVLEDESKTPIQFDAILEAKDIVIHPKESFKQSNTYFVRINNLVGLDGSNMNNEYVLQFTIDDGPKIVSTNISSRFLTTSNIVLTFNQNIKTLQNIKNIVKLNSTSNYTYSISKNQVIINSDGNLDICKNYTINIYKGLVSDTDLVSSSSYTYTLKTTCKRVLVMGTSVQGRPIYAYYFGNGSRKIIFFAAMHGSEANTQSTLTKWIIELENNSTSIPSDKTIIVIPSLNPDGIANRSRFNANGVDLNRNFDSSTWVTGTYLKDEFYSTGGGSAPFSEPESIALRDLIYRESPYVTISYHSAAGYVIPSNTSKAIELAGTYSRLSGYTYINPGADGAFTYDITGTFEEWAEEKGLNGLVVELSSAYVDQFTQNKAAMWDMVKQ